MVAPQKNRAKPEKQKGKKEGGLGEGIFALLRLRIERFRFSLIKRNTKQKKFLFLLKEKIAREKIKKYRENFSVLVCRSGAEASGNAPHSCSGFSLKKVRISFRIRSKVFKLNNNAGFKAFIFLTSVGGFELLNLIGYIFFLKNSSNQKEQNTPSLETVKLSIMLCNIGSIFCKFSLVNGKDKYIFFIYYRLIFS